jgi:hypothetical protein
MSRMIPFDPHDRLRANRCCLCEEGIGLPWRNYNEVRGYKLVQCIRCGFISVDPLPSFEDLEEFYNISYKAEFRKNLPGKESKRLDWLENFSAKRGRLVEMGSSWGYELHAASLRGWQVIGVELSKEAAEFSEREFGLKVYTSLDNVVIEEGTVDAIMAWHLLEHVRSPLHTIKQLITWLRPGGIFVGAVPNISSIQSKLFGRYWQWLSPPAHLHYFSPETLGIFIQLIGLQKIRVQTHRGDAENALINNLSLLMHGLNSKLRKVVPGMAERIRTGARDIGGPLIRKDKTLIGSGLDIARGVSDGLSIAFYPLSYFLNGMGFGEEILFAAVKPTGQ